jgi:hypothetical protein
MTKFKFVVEITGSIQLPMYDDHPDLASYSSYGYGRSFYVEGSICDAMNYAEKLCASEITTESYPKSEPDDCEDYFDEEQDVSVISPDIVKIKSMIHKNIIVGGEVRCSRVDWVIPKIDEDIEKAHQESDQLKYEASNTMRGDNFDSARVFRFRSTLVMLRCSDYWKYMSCEDVA